MKALEKCVINVLTDACVKHYQQVGKGTIMPTEDSDELKEQLEAIGKLFTENDDLN